MRSELDANEKILMEIKRKAPLKRKEMLADCHGKYVVPIDEEEKPSQKPSVAQDK